MGDYDDDGFDPRQFRKDMKTVGKAILIVFGLSILAFIVYLAVSMMQMGNKRRSEYDKRVSDAQKVLREQLKEYYGMENYTIVKSSYGDHGMFPTFEISVGNTTFHAYVYDDYLYTDYLSGNIVLEPLIQDGLEKVLNGASLVKDAQDYRVKSVTVSIPEGHNAPSGQYLPACVTEREADRFKNGESESNKWRDAMDITAVVVIEGNKEKLSEEQFLELADKLYCLDELIVECGEGTYKFIPMTKIFVSRPGDGD